MRVALFKIRLLRKSVSNIRGPIAVTSQNIGAVAPAPTRLFKTYLCKLETKNLQVKQTNPFLASCFFT